MSETDHSTTAVTPLAQETTEKESLEKFLLKRRSKWRLVVVLSTALLFVLMLVSSSLGFVPICLSDIVSMWFSKIPLLSQLFALHSNVSPIDQTVFFQIRLPRIIGAVLVGAGLAASGTVLQDIFSNPLAEPLVIGVSSGAAFGAALSIVLGVGGIIFGFNSVIILAFIGGIISVIVTYGVAGRDPSPNVLLLAGVTVNFLNSAGVAFLTVLAGDRLQALVFWLMGGLGSMSWNVLLPTAPIIVVGIVGILLFSRDLNILLFGEQQAKSLGVNTSRVKIILVALTTVVIATAVSISGIIGFVGLIIPHILRLLVGPDHRILLPSSILGGASFLLLSDTIARTILLPIDIPVGIITAAAGGPFFIYLLKHQQKSLASQVR